MAPESVALRERVQKQARDGLAEQFIAEVNGGQWDAVSYDLVAGALRLLFLFSPLAELTLR